MSEKPLFHPLPTAEVDIFVQSTIPNGYTPVADMIQRGLENSSGLLTARQMQVLVLTSLGYRKKGIATLLGLSSETVNTHMDSLYAQLGISGQIEAVKWGLENGCIQPNDIVPEDYGMKVGELDKNEKNIYDIAATLGTTNGDAIHDFSGMKFSLSSIKNYLTSGRKKLEAVDPSHAAIMHAAHSMLPQEQSEASHTRRSYDLAADDTPHPNIHEQTGESYWLPHDEQVIQQAIQRGLTNSVMLLHYFVSRNDLIHVQNPILVAEAPSYNELAQLFFKHLPEMFPAFKNTDRKGSIPFPYNNGNEAFVIIDSTTTKARETQFSDEAAFAILMLINKYFVDKGISFPSPKQKREYQRRLGF
ncbi:MAG TPA: helix-turn-helix transcriptional regulator [Patescibacteria group bacterium]|nr:helix-turn-helix transcriptional regulator [Patescibacteria group bacterium]